MTLSVVRSQVESYLLYQTNFLPLTMTMTMTMTLTLTSRHLQKALKPMKGFEAFYYGFEGFED